MGAERGAELRTLEPVLYGKFEARYKPAQGEGLVSSFFIYIPFIYHIFYQELTSTLGPKF